MGREALHGDLGAGNYIELVSGSDIDFGNADAGIMFEFEAGGSVNGGDVCAGLTIEGEAGGSVELGNLTAGFESNEAIDDDTFSALLDAHTPRWMIEFVNWIGRYAAPSLVDSARFR